MKKEFNMSKMDHHAKHLALISAVVFLFVLNFSLFNYASASNGSPIDKEVNRSLQNVQRTYQQSSDYMYDYSVVWGELIIGWEDFVVDTYYIMNE